MKLIQFLLKNIKYKFCTVKSVFMYIYSNMGDWIGSFAFDQTLRIDPNQTSNLSSILKNG